MILEPNKLQQAIDPSNIKLMTSTRANTKLMTIKRIRSYRTIFPSFIKINFSHMYWLRSNSHKDWKKQKKERKKSIVQTVKYYHNFPFHVKNMSLGGAKKFTNFLLQYPIRLLHVSRKKPPPQHICLMGGFLSMTVAFSGVIHHCGANGIFLSHS